MVKKTNDIIKSPDMASCQSEISGLTGYPSIDKPWMQYYKDIEINKPVPKVTVYTRIHEQNKNNLDSTAISYYGRNITYRELFNKIDKCARSLKAYGIKCGDCVNMCVASAPEAVYLMLAADKIGATANFLNPFFNKEQMLDRITDTGSDFLVIMAEVGSSVPESVMNDSNRTIIVFSAVDSFSAGKRIAAVIAGKKGSIKSNHITPWNAFIEKGQRYHGETEAPYAADRPAVMVYSSGTTGAPKGIQLTNDGINAFFNMYEELGFSHHNNEKFLQMIPIWFSTGAVLSIMMPLFFSLTVVLEPVFNKDQFVSDIMTYHPNMTLVATSIWVGAIHDPKFQQADLSCLTIPITGGEPLLKDMEDELNSFLKGHGSKTNINKGWGMCELGSSITTSTTTHGTAGSAGIPFPEVIVSAFDTETGEEQVCGKRGELRVISPSHMHGYFKNEPATKEFFHIDHKGRTWGCTGDIGYVDKNGDVYVLGRAGDSYIAEDGRKYYLFDAEKVILQDPAVNTCKVVAIEENGINVPVAHITLKDKPSEKREAIVRRLNQRCRENLPQLAVPKSYKFWDLLPVHPNGKRDIDTLKKERTGFIKVN